MLETLKSRRSIRKYKNTKIDKNILDSLLKSLLLSPSSMNKKPLEFIVVEDKDILSNLEKCKKLGTIALKTAPTAIVIIANTEVSDVWIEDAAIASTILQLQAEHLGLGSCWIQIRNRNSINESSETEVRQALNIPKNYGVLSIITLGYKDEEKLSYEDPIVDSSKFHYNVF